MSKAWFVEIALNTAERLLVWEQAYAAPGQPYAFSEGERQVADLTAIALANMHGDEAVVRVRHRLGEKRGTFIPRPRAARRVAA